MPSNEPWTLFNNPLGLVKETKFEHEEIMFKHMNFHFEMSSLCMLGSVCFIYLSKSEINVISK